MAQERSAQSRTSAEVAREWWRRLSAFDFAGAGALLAPDVVVEWPVSSERFRGRENIVAINEAYPGRWRAEVVRLVADGDTCVTEANVTDGQETTIAVSFFTVRNGLIQTLREFWPEPYPAPAWRSRWAGAANSEEDPEAGVFSAEDAARVEGVVARGLAFLDDRRYALGSAWVRHLWHDGPADAVVDALAGYQNDDGGFGKGLEVDIKAPVSNPFAARLAMIVLLSLRQPAEPVRGPVTDGLDRWLTTTQHDDGDWHFAPEVYQHDLAPWFAGWTFPSLNPACDLAGLAARLGLGNEEMQARVRRLFDERASLDEARTGEFYNLLPYVEYLAGIDHPARDSYLDALAANIMATAERGGYADAGHFFEHAHGGGPDLLRRLPPTLIQSQTARLLAEPEEDGGWPSPYDPAWRPWATAGSLAVLAAMRPRTSVTP